MKRRVYSLLSICVVGILAFACAPPTTPTNPPLNSAMAAHGNTDWHIDTANEFLFGTDMAGTTTAANHCPGTWTRSHIHVGLTNTADYYYDDDVTAGGLDTDTTSGIDRVMLFFYAGHGNATLWNTLGNNATQGNMRLGNLTNAGLLRYFWQCSCETFAHGPHNCPGSTHAYSCPGDFDGSADSWSMRNVYERWGPVLTQDLRLACGVSTSAYCHQGDVNKIWDNYNNKSYDVADSFIDGLHRYSWVTPLCITMGGSNVTATPLFDATFTNQPNTSGTTYYHIQYMEDFDSTPIWPVRLLHPPEMLPILAVIRMPQPGPLMEIKFEQEGDWLLATDLVIDRGSMVRINMLSGAVYLLGERSLDLDLRALGEREYLEIAQEYVQEQGWLERDIGDVIGQRIMIESMPVELEGEGERVQKNVIVTFRRQIQIEDVPVHILGEGGTMTVQMNSDGSVFNAQKVWRQIGEPTQWLPVIPYDEAFEKALAILESPEEYELARWIWGYKEAAGNTEQTEMRIVYQFWFVPSDPEKMIDLPPRLIEIEGQIG